MYNIESAEFVKSFVVHTEKLIYFLTYKILQLISKAKDQTIFLTLNDFASSMEQYLINSLRNTRRNRLFILRKAGLETW
jgi:hypothetical protein